MKLKSFLEFSTYGLRTIFLKNTNPILATIILTDYCNLTCKHCAVNNINKIIHPYEEIKEEMLKLYEEVDGLCQECAYLFAVEFALLFRGNPKIIYETLRTHLKFV